MTGLKRMNHIPALDGLRGVAVLLVMMHHSGFHLFRGGFIGVDLFFIISGFLITSLLIREYEFSATIRFIQFYMRRILRLFPLLVLLLVTYVVVCAIFSSRQGVTDGVIDSLISFFYVTNWAWAFSIHPPDVLRHTWSLSIEEQFYIIWPALLYFFLKRIKKRKLIAYLVLALALSSWLIRSVLFMRGAGIFRLYNGLDTRFDSLMTGALLGLVTSYRLIPEKFFHSVKGIVKVISPLSVLAVIWICLFVDYSAGIVYKWILAGVNLIGFILILDFLVNERSVIKKFLNTEWLVLIGRISYGLYLIHYPIFRAMYYYHFDYKLIILLGTSLSLVLAYLSYSFYEKRFLDLKRKFSYVSTR